MQLMKFVLLLMVSFVWLSCRAASIPVHTRHQRETEQDHEQEPEQEQEQEDEKEKEPEEEDDHTVERKDVEAPERDDHERQREEEHDDVHEYENENATEHKNLHYHQHTTKPPVAARNNAARDTIPQAEVITVTIRKVTQDDPFLKIFNSNMEQARLFAKNEWQRLLSRYTPVNERDVMVANIVDDDPNSPNPHTAYVDFISNGKWMPWALKT